VGRTLRSANELSRKSVTSRAWQHARYAERVEINGLLVHPTAVHGRLRSYTSYGCRGPLCYATWKHYNATGETIFPQPANAQYNVNDCVTFQSDVYPDQRRR
jgi:hypothetical protein